MGSKKKEIVEKYLSRQYLNKNPVAGNIEDILCKLHFTRNPQIGHPWDLFHKWSSNSDKFAVIYKDKKFLMKGDYPGFDVLKEDLYNIENIFNENWVPRKIREKSPGSLGLALSPGFLYLVFLGGVSAYDMSTKSKTIDKAVEYLSTLTLIDGNSLIGPTVVGGALVLGFGGVLGVISAASLINKYYASKLSDEAESYDYGKEAENLLGRELLFEKAKSGEITKQAFLEHFDKV